MLNKDRVSGWRDMRQYRTLIVGRFRRSVRELSTYAPPNRLGVLFFRVGQQKARQHPPEVIELEIATATVSSIPACSRNHRSATSETPAGLYFVDPVRINGTWQPSKTSLSMRILNFSCVANSTTPLTIPSGRVSTSRRGLTRTESSSDRRM